MEGEDNNISLPEVKSTNASLEEIAGDIPQRILEEQSPAKVDELLNWFNLAQTKKNALRIMEWDRLLDAVREQMGERLEKRSHEFTNEELIKYAQVIQDTINKGETKIGNARDEIKHITINQNNVNIEMPGQTRDSRERIMAAVQAILQNMDVNEEHPGIIIDGGDEDDSNGE